MASKASASPEMRVRQLRALVQNRLRELRDAPRPAPPNPPPRYDEIFALGQQWLDELATDPNS